MYREKDGKHQVSDDKMRGLLSDEELDAQLWEEYKSEGHPENNFRLKRLAKKLENQIALSRIWSKPFTSVAAAVLAVAVTFHSKLDFDETSHRHDSIEIQFHYLNDEKIKIDLSNVKSKYGAILLDDCSDKIRTPFSGVVEKAKTEDITLECSSDCTTQKVCVILAEKLKTTKLYCNSLPLKTVRRVSI